VLHVGPHKTGTTSLQKALLKEYGSENPQKIWYPIPAEFGPGHAKVARAALGRGGFSEPQPAIRQKIEQALQSDCDALILSSEVFADAYPNLLTSLADQTADTDAHIIVTLSPICSRSVSVWQELVKHKWQSPLESAEHLSGHPGLAPDLTASLARSFPTAKMSVIIADKVSATNLYAFFSQATGIPLPIPRTPEELMLNPGQGRIEAEVLRAFNIAAASASLPNATYQKGRKLLRALFKSKEWSSTIPMVPLVLPQDWIEPLGKLCAETIAQLKELAAQGRIDIFGDVESLDDSRLEAVGLENSDSLQT
jgi:hypothetical protein